MQIFHTLVRNKNKSDTESYTEIFVELIKFNQYSLKYQKI